MRGCEAAVYFVHSMSFVYVCVYVLCFVAGTGLPTAAHVVGPPPFAPAAVCFREERGGAFCSLVAVVVSRGLLRWWETPGRRSAAARLLRSGRGSCCRWRLRMVAGSGRPASGRCGWGPLLLLGYATVLVGWMAGLGLSVWV